MLQITHKEASGFHHLQSLITFLGEGDQICVTESNNFSLSIDGEFRKSLPVEGNLVLKAARWLGTLYPSHPKAHVTLTKNLPLSSGIGGGSSDAAATIAALLKLWGITLNSFQKINLIKVSGILGADVPVCLAYHLLKNNFFWVNGTGKEGQPISLWQEERLENQNPLSLLLINPRISISTPHIFKAYNKIYDEPILPPTSFNQLLSFLKETKNSLTPAACELAPQIAETLNVLNNTTGCLLARMSGSGSTCFGLYDNSSNCHIAHKIIKETYPEWWVYTR